MVLLHEILESSSIMEIFDQQFLINELSWIKFYGVVSLSQVFW